MLAARARGVGVTAAVAATALFLGVAVAAAAGAADAAAFLFFPAFPLADIPSPDLAVGAATQLAEEEATKEAPTAPFENSEGAVTTSEEVEEGSDRERGRENGLAASTGAAPGGGGRGGSTNGAGSSSAEEGGSCIC